MPRRLSDVEYVWFFQDVDLAELPIPPWGIVLRWNDKDVLVFESFQGEVFLTDITDIRESIEISPPWEYHPDLEYAVWHLPEETAGVIMEVVEEVYFTCKVIILQLIMQD